MLHLPSLLFWWKDQSYSSNYLPSSSRGTRQKIRSCKEKSSLFHIGPVRCRKYSWLALESGLFYDQWWWTRFEKFNSYIPRRFYRFCDRLLSSAWKDLSWIHISRSSTLQSRAWFISFHFCGSFNRWERSCQPYLSKRSSHGLKRIQQRRPSIPPFPTYGWRCSQKLQGLINQQASGILQFSRVWKCWSLAQRSS